MKSNPARCLREVSEHTNTHTDTNRGITSKKNIDVINELIWFKLYLIFASMKHMAIYMAEGKSNLLISHVSFAYIHLFDESTKVFESYLDM